jgi:hypothetical protein
MGSHPCLLDYIGERKPPFTRLQRIQEGEEFLLLRRSQLAEMLAYVVGLAAVPFDGVFQGQGFKIVHVPRVRSQAPERHCAQLVSCVLRRILHDAVAGSDVYCRIAFGRPVLDSNREAASVLSFVFSLHCLFGSMSLVCDLQRMLRRNKSGITACSI